MSDEEAPLIDSDEEVAVDVPELKGFEDDDLVEDIEATLHPNVPEGDPNPFLTSGKLKLRDALSKIKAKLRRKRLRQLRAHNDNCIARNRDTIQFHMREWPEWVWNELPVYTYILNYIALDVMIVMAARNSADASDPNDIGATTYNPVTMIVMSELVKMVVSVLLWLFISKKPGAKLLRRRGVWFALPALLYSGWYMLNFATLINVQRGQYTVFMQVQYLFYILLWAFVFRKKVKHPKKPNKSIRVFRITPWQWAAIALLSFAVCLVRVNDQFTWNTQGKPAWGLFVLMLQAFTVAAVGVFNEYLYKNVAFADIDLNQQNMYLYSLTLLFSLFYATFLIATESSFLPSFAAAFDGFFTTINILILLLAALLGLQVSLILKVNNNVVRAFAQAVHVPGQILLTQAIAPPAGRPLQSRDDWIRMIFGSVLIAVAAIMMLYNGGFHTSNIIASGRRLMRKKRGAWGALASADALALLQRQQASQLDARRALAKSGGKKTT